ncbi:MAG: BLUF domain-containing protein [Rhodobacteraceae bacterium]|nr:BLUF domain-containing protein [Paracoccaceae bacterium]
MPIDYLVYVSQAAGRPGEADIAAILKASRAYNAAHGITGMLIYAPARTGSGGSFLQLLEGEAGEIERLRARIFADGRHHTKVVLARGTRPERAFDDWSMAFRAATPGRLAAFPAFADLGEAFFHDKLQGHSADGVLDFLRDFWEAED